MSLSTKHIPKRPLAHTLVLLALWIAFYASFTLFRPALLDDADSVHAEVAREMLLRHDWVTLYANGIRYLEKAPLLYWSMAASMAAMQMLGHASARALAVAARIPLALSVLALAFVVEVFARRAFGSARAGLYAALVLLSCPGIFLFTRILLPDAMLCLWIALALLCLWKAEELPESRTLRLQCYGFAACCALGVLTKGLIGLVFPVAIAAIYLLLARGVRGAIRRMLRLYPVTSFAVFLAIAAPWHVLAALANPTQGTPGGLAFALHPVPGAAHFSVPLPTDGKVHGWAWFYFVNEQVLRYLNLRVPRDYDTVPLWLFWGLCLIWLMPWSALMFKALGPVRAAWREQDGANIILLLATAAALPLLFFSLSTRQEYYVLPSLPPVAMLIGGWLSYRAPTKREAVLHRRAAWRCNAVLVCFGFCFAAASLFAIRHSTSVNGKVDLADVLQQHPSDYALSMGHFLDLNAQALGFFRLPLAIAAVSLFLCPSIALFLRRAESSIHPIRLTMSVMSARLFPRLYRAVEGRKRRIHAANLVLAAGAFGFLLAAHLGLQTFAPVLSSQQLAAAIAPQIGPDDLVVIHQEYEYGSTLGFYLQRPSYRFYAVRESPPRTTPPTDHDTASVGVRAVAVNPIRVLTEPEYHGTRDYGRSSNLWYGSFFPDAPAIFETKDSLAAEWRGTRRVFLWQDLANQPSGLPTLPGPVYVIARSGGKEIVSNQPNWR